MEEYYVLSIVDNGKKKYYADTDGWIEDKSEAVWFPDFQSLLNVAFDEGLEENEFEVEKGWY